MSFCLQIMWKTDWHHSAGQPVAGSLTLSVARNLEMIDVFSRSPNAIAFVFLTEMNSVSRNIFSHLLWIINAHLAKQWLQSSNVYLSVDIPGIPNRRRMSLSSQFLSISRSLSLCDCVFLMKFHTQNLMHAGFYIRTQHCVHFVHRCTFTCDYSRLCAALDQRIKTTITPMHRLNGAFNLYTTYNFYRNI